MSDEDDWFERALQGGDDEDDDGENEATAGEDAPDLEQPVPDAGSSDTGGDGGGLFDDDFATAFENAGDAAAPMEGDGAPSGMGQADDFGMGSDFGFGAPSSGAQEFGDDDPDSELLRIDLGIEGLDNMIQGGVPERSLMAVIGSAGTGKTTFGLQFLQEGLQNGEQVVYLTLEESRKRVINSATEKGWAFDEYAETDQLAIVDMDPVEMANSLSSIRSELPRLIRSFGAERMVLDSVSLLEMMYENRARRRNEVFEFARTLKESGVTTMMTSEAADDNPYASRHGIVEYLTDAVFIMRYVRPSDFQETRLAIEIQKIRDAHHSREMKPYDITEEGISVYRQANIF